ASTTHLGMAQPARNGVSSASAREYGPKPDKAWEKNVRPDRRMVIIPSGKCVAIHHGHAGSDRSPCPVWANTLLPHCWRFLRSVDAGSPSRRYLAPGLNRLAASLERSRAIV